MKQAQYYPGKAIGRLVLRRNDGHHWLCQCSCGKEPTFHVDDLAKVRSCGCIVILGLDIATTTGWAVRYSWRHASGIACGTFYVGENDAGDKLAWEEKYALAANHVYKLLKEHKPDFVAIEQPEHGIRKFARKDESTGDRIDVAAIKSFVGRLSAVMFKHGLQSAQAQQVVSSIAGGSSNANQMQLSGLVGAAVGACMNMKVPFGTIAARTWHSMFCGKGVKPPQGMDWKDLVIQICEREGIPLPSTKAAKRDAADAVGISACWHKCDLPNFKWVHDRFTDLRTKATAVLAARKREAPTEDDLFAGVAA